MPLPLFPKRAQRRVRQTSIAAFHALPDKQTKAQQVYDVIKKLGEASDKDVAEYLHWPINTVTPRRNELVNQEKLVVESRRGKHPATGMRVIYWKAID